MPDEVLEDAREPDSRLIELYNTVIAGVDAIYRHNPVFQRRLVAVANSVVRDWHMAADIVQDCAADRYSDARRYRDARDFEKLEKAAADFAAEGVAITTVYRKSLDYKRRKDNRDVGSIDAFEAADTVSLTPLYDSPSVFGDPSEVVTQGVDPEGLHAHLRTLVVTLQRRHARGVATTLALTAQQLEYLLFFFRFDLLPELEALENNPPEAPDLVRARQRIKQRIERQESRPVRGYDPNFGMNALLAKHYPGVTPSAITAEFKVIRAVVRVAVYLTGILGRFHAMDHSAAIDEHLDVFDRWCVDTTRQPAAKRLRVASGAVRTNVQTGTRVSKIAYARNCAAWQYADPASPSALDPSDWAAVNAEADKLHAVESDYAAAVVSHYPRCVLACNQHTP